MSGIAGLLRFDGHVVDRGVLERMAGALDAHGPDRSAIYVAGAIGVAHRLMRMTPEDIFDRQPLRGASGAIMTADLRLDNREDLGRALGLNADVVRTSADSMLVLAAWERWGDAVWARLRGPFAVAIWNPSDRKLRLARDPMGINVLVWYRTSAFFAFATLPKGLFALPDVARVLNEEKFADFLVLNHAEQDTTFYRNVFRLLPAHLAVVDAAGALTLQRYWSADDIAPVRLKSDTAYAEGMREHLDRAVRRQLRSRYPVGCFLSGGLDSSSVAALAARALAEKSKRLPAYTQVPRRGFAGPVGRGRYADETPYVEALRQLASTIDVTYVDNSQCDDFAELERIFYAVETPVRNPTNLGWMVQIPRLAAANGQRVLLGGDLGNVTLSWEGWSQAADHLCAGRLLTAWQQWQLYSRITGRSRLSAFRRLFLRPLGIDLRSLIARFRYRKGGVWLEHSAINPAFAIEMRVAERAERVGHDFLYRHRGANQLRSRMLVPADYRGDWHAGVRALYGVELRDPTSDLDLVGFCLGVPMEQYLAEDADRSLVRRAMRGLVPQQVLDNRLRGMQAADWYEKLERRRPAMEAEIAQLRQSALVRKAIDIERLQNAVCNWPTGNWQKGNIINEFQLALPRGLAGGRFLRWFERKN